MKAFRFIVLALLFTSCNTPKATFDYDEQVEFNNYNTYALYPELATALSGLDERRLITSLRQGLERKGIPQSDQPDLFINVYSEEYQEASGNTLGVGVGGGGGNLGVGVSGGIPLGGPKTLLRLTFDIIDVERDELIWQAIVEKGFDFNASPEKRQIAFDKMVAKALEGFPPDE